MLFYICRYKELLKAAKNEPRSVTRRFIRETTRDSFRANRALVDPVEINKKVNSGITALRMIQVAQQTGKGGERRLMKNITYIEQTRDRTSKIENKYNIQDLIDKQYVVLNMVV